MENRDRLRLQLSHQRKKSSGWNDFVIKNYYLTLNIVSDRKLLHKAAVNTEKGIMFALKANSQAHKGRIFFRCDGFMCTINKNCAKVENANKSHAHIQHACMPSVLKRQWITRPLLTISSEISTWMDTRKAKIRTANVASAVAEV